VLIHAYLKVNLNRVWRTDETDLPPLDTVALLGTFQQIRWGSGACSTAQSRVGAGLFRFCMRGRGGLSHSRPAGLPGC
jgi:hypothetical protein